MQAVGVDKASLLAHTPAAVKAAYGRSGMGDDQLAESIYTDGRFAAPARWFASKMSVAARAYVYYFSYVTSQLRYLGPGASHGAELTYVFQTGDWQKRLYGADWSDEDRHMAHLIHSCWVGFVRDGDPRCDGTAWPRFDSDSDEIIEFGAETGVRTHFKSRVYDALEKAYLARALSY